MTALRVLIIACEASADQLGADLMRDLNSGELGGFISQQIFLHYGQFLAVKSDAELAGAPHKHHNLSFDFRGIGGEKMVAAGLTSVEGYGTFSVIGILESLMVIPKAYAAMGRVMQLAQEFTPHLILTIDSPGFNFILVKKIRKKLLSERRRHPEDKLAQPQPLFIHYVAPSVWARKPQRALLVSKLYDHLMLILPFEREYFSHMSSEYVGHPVLERRNRILQQAQSHGQGQSIDMDKSERRRTLPADSLPWRIGIMPGSRAGEINNHMPIILEAMDLLSSRVVVEFTFFATRCTEPLIRSHIEGYRAQHGEQLLNWAIVGGDVAEDMRAEQIARSNLIWVKSGTSTLDVAALAVPMVTFYRLSAITEFILKRQLSTARFNLVNLILQKDILPELVGCDRFTADGMAQVTLDLLDNRPLREEYAAACDHAIDLMAVVEGEKYGMEGVKEAEEDKGTAVATALGTEGDANAPLPLEDSAEAVNPSAGTDTSTSIKAEGLEASSKSKQKKLHNEAVSVALAQEMASHLSMPEGDINIDTKDTDHTNSEGRISHHLPAKSVIKALFRAGLL